MGNGERGRGCWLVQAAGKPGERLHNEGLSWTSFWTFWEGWGTQHWPIVQAPIITETQAGVGVARERRGKQSAGGEGTLRLRVTSPEGGAHLPSGLLDPGRGPRPLHKRLSVVRGLPALPVVAQPPGGAGALGHPGEPGAGLWAVVGGGRQGFGGGASRGTLAV